MRREHRERLIEVDTAHPYEKIKMPDMRFRSILSERRKKKKKL